MISERLRPVTWSVFQIQDALDGRALKMDDAFRINQGDQIRGVFDERAKMLLAAAQFRFGAPAGGDIAQNGRVNFFAAGLRLGDGHFDRELLAVGAQGRQRAQGAHRARCLAGLPKIPDMLAVSRAVFLGDEPVQLLAQRLLRAALKHPLGGRVEQDDALVFIHRDDRVHRGRHQGRHQGFELRGGNGFGFRRRHKMSCSALMKMSKRT